MQCAVCSVQCAMSNLYFSVWCVKFWICSLQWAILCVQFIVCRLSWQWASYEHIYQKVQINSFEHYLYLYLWPCVIQIYSVIGLVIFWAFKYFYIFPYTNVLYLFITVSARLDHFYSFSQFYKWDQSLPTLTDCIEFWPVYLFQF